MRHQGKAMIWMFISGMALIGYTGSAMSQENAAPMVEKKAEFTASIDPQRIQHGKLLFSENCQVCHQEEGKGKPGVAPSLTSKELLTAASDEFLLTNIRDGRADTPMPAWGETLKTEEIHDIISYLRSYATGPMVGNMLDKDHTAMGDPRLGKRWFSQICAGCHGPNGEGYEGSGSGTAIGRSGFLNKATDGFIRYIIQNGRSNTAMRGFSGAEGLAHLNEQEIDDIISYLRILQ